MHIHLSIEGAFLTPGLKTGFGFVTCMLFERGPMVRGLNMFLLCKSSTSHLPVKERIWENSFQE